MIKSRQFKLSHGNIAALEVGNEVSAEISIVFIHGWLDNAASFIEQLKLLSQAFPQIHILAIDLPGHGLSDHKSADNYYYFHDYISDLHFVLRKLSANKLILVGHSLGAAIASCYSAAFPDQVCGLVTLDNVRPLVESAEYSVSRLRQSIISRERNNKKKQRFFSTFESVLMVRAQTNHIAPELLEPMMRRGTREEDGRWYWRHDLKLQCDSLYRMAAEHAEMIMSQIQCEHLIILGEHGFHPENIATKTWGCHAAQVVRIPGGHHCHLEQPDQVAKLIIGLVNKI